MKFFLELLSCNRISHAEWVFFSASALKYYHFQGGRNNFHCEVVWETPPTLKSTCSLELSDWIFKDGSFSSKHLLVVLAWTIHDGVPPRRYLLLSSEYPFSSDLIAFQVGVHHLNDVTTLLTFIFRKQTDHLFNWSLSNNSFSCHAQGSTFTASAVLCAQLRWPMQKTRSKASSIEQFWTAQQQYFSYFLCKFSS